ncbi:uncharacterized protein LOC116948777 [Petromyzon marinus]|uniref:Hepatocyte cell adhesion molecule-like n=1 Tax=Petromyzon marinus TaxID=7757 RepID=A0AAJ7TQJ4_PETMA|nr:hepatocyte cell adhesion molecule-like [Petromyzon marinus]
MNAAHVPCLPRASPILSEFFWRKTKQNHFTCHRFGRQRFRRVRTGPKRLCRVEERAGSRLGAALPPTEMRALFLLAAAASLTAGSSRAVNVTGPAGSVRGTAASTALLSVRYSSQSGGMPVIKWRLIRPTSGAHSPSVSRTVMVVQSFGGEGQAPAAEFANRVHVFRNGSLQLMLLRLSDEGTYEVEITITEDAVVGHHSVQLTVDVPISKPVVIISSPVAVEMAEAVTMNCSHVNGTRAVYAWLKGGAPLTNGSRHRLSAGGHSLTLAPVLLGDSDSYACLASNAVSRGASEPVLLTVHRRMAVYLILGGCVILIAIVITSVCLCCNPSKTAEAESAQLSLTEKKFPQPRRGSASSLPYAEATYETSRGPATRIKPRDRGGNEGPMWNASESCESRVSPHTQGTYHGESRDDYRDECSSGSSGSGGDHHGSDGHAGVGDAAGAPRVPRPGGATWQQQQERRERGLPHAGEPHRSGPRRQGPGGHTDPSLGRGSRDDDGHDVAHCENEDAQSSRSV